MAEVVRRGFLLASAPILEAPLLIVGIKHAQRGLPLVLVNTDEVVLLAGFEEINALAH
ncbi:hypothetical protein D3C76_1848870 [compost metagenome]